MTDTASRPERVLAGMLLSGMRPEAIGAALPPGSTVARVFAARRTQLDIVARMLAEAGVEHAQKRDAAAIARMFDAAVAIAPEASVAAYTLGDPGILAAATTELVAWLGTEHLIWPTCRVLDLGCGIGRVAAALAPQVGSVLGLDCSAGMIAEATRRCRAIPGLRFAVTDGAPPALPASSVDLVLAVDSFPYLVQAGIADAHVAAAARLLRPGGALVILNLSYQGEDAESALARTYAATVAIPLVCCGERPFRHWDGAAFVWRPAG